ncbi:hypothetical protein I4I73_13315 [Pseudonocardia sp. KRD-184]|uniref:NUDIX domain-containing protein n=1 Tax=Pseudonocardia oceani TaxID=2792013 RepID=A0ABS6UHI4_9PSEU|nr:hypothetical protein [Pseudonocardia oceani]MBW0089902.1 hypothetical protein [Pseudonocardia oceani]MBW0096967.1 hypothetical protein [Pseudonocardia oceani]MBW0109642.1 hypothetical protein [Pseudonocardia oceani]MBW0122502.1 hypothetical protein [Pseudonocardia oceani]MBW0131678.1 hypothetical protein [Pseudonocardia oceani]
MTVPTRTEHYRDAGAPPATVVVPLVYAVVRDAAGRLLLVRRVDTGDRELPGAPRPDGCEASEARWWDVADVGGLPMHPAVRQRVRDAIGQLDRVHLG